MEKYKLKRQSVLFVNALRGINMPVMQLCTHFCFLFKDIFFSGFLRYDYIILIGLGAKKPVFGTSDQVRQKPACSTTENSYNIGILHVTSLTTILLR